jgi:hypothetical protein
MWKDHEIMPHETFKANQERSIYSAIGIAELDMFDGCCALVGRLIYFQVIEVCKYGFI